MFRFQFARIYQRLYWAFKFGWLVWPWDLHIFIRVAVYKFHTNITKIIFRPKILNSIMCQPELSIPRQRWFYLKTEIKPERRQTTIQYNKYESLPVSLRSFYDSTTKGWCTSGSTVWSLLYLIRPNHHVLELKGRGNAIARVFEVIPFWSSLRNRNEYDDVDARLLNSFWENLITRKLKSQGSNLVAYI